MPPMKGAPARPLDPSAMDESLLMRKLQLRLMPLLGICFLAAFLDRVNVGFAALEMQADLGFSDTVYSFGAGLFFIGYFLFEVPSNLILERVGARFWIARIMVVWGLVSSAMMFVRDETTFYLLRFLLGAAEAGFFPGVILYLTYFFPAAFRSRTIALFMTAPALSGVIGGPLSGLLLDHHPTWIRGWQWLFLVEGLPSVLLGGLVWFLLPNGPADARWLSTREKAWLRIRLDAERTAQGANVGSALRALLHPRVLGFCLIYFLLVIGAYGFDFFMPKVLSKAFPGISKLELGLLAAIPPACSVIVMVWWGRRSDQRAERRFHVFWPAVWAAAGLLIVSFDVAPLVALAAAAIAVTGRWSTIPPFWGLPTAFLGGSAAAGSIALINSVGNLGGFAGPLLMGAIKDVTGSYVVGMRALAAAYLLGGGLALLLGRDNTQRTDRGPAPEG
jgi:MFS transporter, ACS family, tartrate transporter